MTFNAQQCVGEIVAAFPGASNLFKRYGIDFCCGGNRSLGEALAQKAIATDAFLANLEAAYQAQQLRQEAGGVDWREASYSDLIDQIVGAHHQYLKDELPVISGFATKIFHVHGPRHPELGQLYRQFHQFKMELDMHLQDEESRVFPLIRAYAQSGAPSDLEAALACIEELEAEHQAAGDLLLAMRETTRGYALPPDACRTYTLTFEKMQELESDMFNHVHLENNILFPRLRAAR